jgi:hypothetical protein
VRFYIAAINEDPFQIGVCSQHTEAFFPEAFFRPFTERFVDRISFAERVWQISPGHAGPHSEKRLSTDPRNGALYYGYSV